MAQKIQRKPQIDQTMKKIFKSNFQPKYGYFGKTMCTVVAVQGDFRPKKIFLAKKKIFFFGPKKKKFFFLGPTVGPQSPTVGLQSPSVGLQSPTDGPLSPSVGLRGSDCRTQGVSPLFTHSKHDRPHREGKKKKKKNKKSGSYVISRMSTPGQEEKKKKTHRLRRRSWVQPISLFA